MAKPQPKGESSPGDVGREATLLNRILYFTGAALGVLLLIGFASLERADYQAFGRASWLFTGAFFLYAAAAVLSVVNSFFVKSTFAFRLTTGLLFGGLALSVTSMIHRWTIAGRPPFKTYYESLILLAACTAATYLVLELATRVRIVGPFATAMCAGTYLLALSKMDEEILDLPAALQSFWFIPHVLLYFVAYAALGVAFCAGVVYLITPGVKVLGEKNARLFGRREMDFYQYTYRIIVFGFLFLSLGLVTGGVWAKSAWGDYWVWDPKENWSLITWLIYLTYLHLKSVRGWKGRKAVVFSIIGFAAVIFCYLMMHLLPTAVQSDHVYSG